MRRIKYLLCAVVMSAFFVLSCFSIGAVSSTPAPFTLRVGYWKDYGLAYDQNGRFYGYTYDYFNEIASINGWQVEYIACNWNEGLDMLQRGELDIFGPMQKTPEREQILDYPSYSMGFEYGVLYVNKNNQDIFYDDLKSFDGKTVAVIPGDYFSPLFQQICAENNVNLQYQFMNNIDSINAALHDGTVDLFVSGNMLMPPDTKIALHFAPQKFYYPTTKGNTFVQDGLNHALDQIHRKNVNFNAELYKKHYVSTSLQNEAFTRAEKEYIQNTPVVRVGYLGEQTPFEFYDDSSGLLRGITPDIVQRISDYTGLTFEFVLVDDPSKLTKMLDDNSLDMVSAVTDEKNLGSLYSLVTTDSFLETKLNFIVKQGYLFDKNELVLALPKNWVTIQNHMKTYYSINKIKLYDTPAQCLDAVLHEEANITVQNSLLSETNLKPYKYRQLTVHSMRWGKTGLRFGVMPESTHLLSILNKSISSITAQTINEIVYQHTIRMPYEPSVADKLRYNAPLLLLIVFSFLFTIYLFSLRYQRMLNKLAFSDTLTGEMNLNKFKLKTKELLNRSSDQASFFLMSLDIDKFKSINNLYGYAYGDRLIQTVARALCLSLPANALLCRDTGDRFYLFFSYMDETAFATWFDTMVAKVDSEIVNDMPECHAVLSCGVCLAQPKDDIIVLLDQSNLARLKVKGYHQSSFAVYQQSMYDQINNVRALENDMSAALKNEEFVVYLQPKIALSSGHVAGAEALVRWMRPDKGLVPPNEFIPLFEQNGFVVDLDFYMLEQVCKTLERWKQEGRALFPISVNFSRRHLFLPDTVTCLTNIISRYDVSPSLIEIELTESAFDNCNIPSISALFHLLHQQGVSVSVDDFGVGYSSLSLLKDLPIDALKIDKSFFHCSQNSIASADRSEILLASVIQLSKQLHIRTISEGVETEQQVHLLQRLGCDLVQGFYFARPMPIVQLEEQLQSNVLIAQAYSNHQ